MGQALNGIAFDAIYTSPLQRAQQTGQAIREQLSGDIPEAKIFESLKEVGLPLWEGMLFSDVQTQYPEQYQQWSQAPHLLKMDVESDGQTTEVFPIQL